MKLPAPSATRFWPPLALRPVSLVKAGACPVVHLYVMFAEPVALVADEGSIPPPA
jgi:hypothetical protein